MTIQWFLVVIIGLFAGILSGLLGVGGGLVIVPLLHFVLKLDIHQSIGTSLAIIVPTAAVGALRHHWAGHIAWQYFLAIAIFATLGGLLGAQLTTSISSRMLERIFAVFLVVVAARMLIGH